MSRILQNFLERFVRHGDLEVETASGACFRSVTGKRRPPRFASRIRRRSGVFCSTRNSPSANCSRMEVDRHARRDFRRADDSDAQYRARRATAMAGGHSKMARRLKRWGQRNSLTSARRNVEHHYDIDPRIYDLFLDSDRLYSCAYFETPDQSLEESQLAKKRHIASKLLIEPAIAFSTSAAAGRSRALFARFATQMSRRHSFARADRDSAQAAEDEVSRRRRPSR